MLQSMVLQRVGHDLANEQQPELDHIKIKNTRQKSVQRLFRKLKSVTGRKWGRCRHRNGNKKFLIKFLGEISRSMTYRHGHQVILPTLALMKGMIPWELYQSINSLKM